MKKLNYYSLLRHHLEVSFASISRPKQPTISGQPKNVVNLTSNVIIEHIRTQMVNGSLFLMEKFSFRTIILWSLITVTVNQHAIDLSVMLALSRIRDSIVNRTMCVVSGVRFVISFFNFSSDGQNMHYIQHYQPFMVGSNEAIF